MHPIDGVQYEMTDEELLQNGDWIEIDDQDSETDDDISISSDLTNDNILEDDG